MRNLIYTIVFIIFMNFSVSLYASDNTDLLTTEPTVVAPDFDARTFTTCQEFESTMEKILPKQNNYYWRGGPIMLESVATDVSVATPPTAKAVQGAGATTPHSETNVQVA
jgi:uncharacterized secreted protein with C-terminal beta-propeller domain